MLIMKRIATIITTALALWHLFAFALLLFTVLPTISANSIPRKGSVANANAANAGDNFKVGHRAVRADVLMRGQAVIDTVPIPERTAFIRYELAKAMNCLNFTTNNRTGLSRAINTRFSFDANVFLTPPQLSAIENIPAYTEFAGDLYYWVRDRLQITEESILELIESRSSILCTADGVCFSQEEIGEICCPF